MIDAIPPESDPPPPPASVAVAAVAAASPPPFSEKVTVTFHACRVCGGEVFEMLNLGNQPLANDLPASPGEPVAVFPLAVNVCRECSLAQLSHCVDKEVLYSDYNYITPDSEDLRRHYDEVRRFLAGKGMLSDQSAILDIGSNIGRLLEFMKPHVGSVLGVDPATNIAEMANAKGIPTINCFFNRETAAEIRDRSGRRNVIFARHCFAHNDEPGLMLEGVAEVLDPEGVLLIENAYFGDTVEEMGFDQVYHEHMYYYNVRGISRILEGHGMHLVDVHHSDIHGGTMLFVAQFKGASAAVDAEVGRYLEAERDMHLPEFYQKFTRCVSHNRDQLRRLVDELLTLGKTVHAYGASAKATTLLNYYGFTSEQIPLVVDSTPTKHGKYIPGAGIEVISEEQAAGQRPDFYLLTIWNYRDEIIRKVRAGGNHHSQFILPHPEVRIVSDPES